MLQYKIGMLAKSKSGHDKGHLYMINEIEEEYVYLVNGSTRTLENPKKKKKMHIQIQYRIPDMIKEKIDAGIIIQNEDIKSAIGG